MANEILGRCACPLCGADDAEIKRGEKGAAYLKCDECVTLIRSSSRAGQRRIIALSAEAQAKWPEVKIEPPAKPDTPASEREAGTPAGPGAVAPPAVKPKPIEKPAAPAKKPATLWGIQL